MENWPAQLRLYQRWWQRPDTFGLIKYFHPGFWKFVLPNEELTNFTIEDNGPCKGYTFYNTEGRVMCIEYAESSYVDNGPGLGYTFYYPGGIRAGVGALEIWDKYDGECDIIYGGSLPGPNWADRPFDKPAPTFDAITRTVMKDRIRERVPLSGNVGLFYHPDALLDSRQNLVILAGPSIFSPECTSEYFRVNHKILNGTFEDDDMPQNWNVLVDQHSLSKLVSCTTNHDPDLFWTSRSGYVYPMLYIVPEQCFSWTPRDYSTWVPGHRLQEFLDTYEYREGEVDPRIPEAYWPNGKNYSLDEGGRVEELYE
ncbi:hypothetical protein F4803DRAFT_550661 [Xylaria telfairii]|nr:hypothetical protein F4803DRAFT_550661 [Xylaria telfairii]